MSKSNKGKKYDQQFHLDLDFGEALQRFANVDVEVMSTLDEGIEDNGAAPFVKWVGGKRSIIGELKKRLPDRYNEYWEPFVGGGAMFFDIQPKRSHLSDANLDLIITYKVIKKDVEKLITVLKKHKRLHCEEYYYRVRDRHNLEDPIEIAARMIYLNKTCFNGLYRVNKKGEFNTPIGKSATGTLASGILREENLKACNKALKNTFIEYRDYKTIAPAAGDFVYFDPPYHPINGTSFTNYAAGDFTEEDQSDLAFFCRELHRRGVKVMLSNSNTEYIRNLYSANFFNIAIVNAPRNVNCKANGRNPVEEVLITNY